MPDLTLALIAFLFPLAYSPGPGNLFFAAMGARFGTLASLPATTGYHLATLVVTAAIGLGFTSFAGAAPVAFDVIRHAGAAYVFWLAWLFLRAGAADLGGEARRAGFMDGLILLVLNPKAYVIIALMFSQFLTTGAQDNVGTVLWITAVFTLNNLVAFTAWTMLGDVFLRQFRTPARARPLNLAFGGLLGLVAAWMLLR